MQESMITKLSPPWYAYHRKVQALFGRDPEVHIKDLADLGNGEFSYMILVYNKKKAEAIKAILPQSVKMGNVTISVAILGPGEDDIESCQKTVTEMFQDAFSGNPVFEKAVERTVGAIKMSYCIFAKEVIQFWNDDLSDFYGNYNGLASDIAREILNPLDILYSISAE